MRHDLIFQTSEIHDNQIRTLQNTTCFELSPPAPYQKRGVWLLQSITDWRDHSVLICYSFSLSHRLLEGEKWVSDWDSQIISKGMILSKKLGCLARCHSCQNGLAAHQQLSGPHDQSIESWFLNASQWGSSYKEVASLDMSRVMTHGRSNVTVSAAVLRGDYVNFRLWFASVSDIMFNNFHLVISMHP